MDLVEWQLCSGGSEDVLKWADPSDMKAKIVSSVEPGDAGRLEVPWLLSPVAVTDIRTRGIFACGVVGLSSVSPVIFPVSNVQESQSGGLCGTQ